MMTEFLPIIIDLLVASLAFLLAGLLHGIARFYGTDTFQYRGWLFIVSVILFSIEKVIWTFSPFWPCDHRFCLVILGIPVVALAIYHSYVRRSGHRLIVLILLCSAFLPFLMAYTHNPLPSSLALMVIGVTWALYRHKRTVVSRKEESNVLSAIGGALLVILGLDILGSDIAPWLPIACSFAELLLVLFGCWYIANRLYSEDVGKESYLFLCFTIIVTGLYFLFMNHMIGNYKKNFLMGARNDLVILKERLDEYKDRCLKELKLLSWHPAIENVIKQKTDGWVEMSLLEMELDASLIYIVDRDGKVIAASNDIILGQNLRDRTYFKKALGGNTNISLAKDPITNAVGAYFARPILDSSGYISHVLVMKMPISDIIINDINSLNIMLINPDSAVLLGPPSFVEKTLFDVSGSQIRELQREQILGDTRPVSLGFSRDKNDIVVDRMGTKYFFITVPIEPIGWSLARLIPCNTLFTRAWGYLAAYFILMVSLILAGLRWFHAREWAYCLEQEKDRRKRAEGVEYLLTSIIEQGSEGVLITDENGKIEYVNKAFSDITGYSRAELIGNHPRILKSTIHTSEFYKNLLHQIKKGRTWHGRMTNRKKDGSFYEADVTIFPILDENEKIKYICIQRDITNEVMLERQLIQAQKMEAVGTLAGGIAHDFNNLLTGLQGYAEIGLLKTAPGDPLRYNLEQILSICKKAASIVKQLLIFSRQESSERVRINLNTSIDELHKLLNRLIGEDVKIILKPKPDLPDILADPVNIEQILVNLVINAKDAMDKGGEIIIETDVVDLEHVQQIQKVQNLRPGKYVKLSIQDTGCGIPREVIPKIFDPFFTTKGPGKGTGLGLSVVYSIVRQHGGWIEVHSNIGEGTRFNIYFPVAKNDKEVARSLVEEDRVVIHGGGRLALFIEDEDQVRDVVQHHMERMGFKVLVAKDLKEAKSIIDQHGNSISIIVSDLVLPDGNGFYFLRNMGLKCPIIFSTGYIDKMGLRSEILKMGYQFILKPYSEKDLARALKEALGQ